jgi:hypothetical protein
MDKKKGEGKGEEGQFGVSGYVCEKRRGKERMKYY